jgi:hypothetical protein
MTVANTRYDGGEYQKKPCNKAYYNGNGVSYLLGRDSISIKIYGPTYSLDQLLTCQDAKG